MLRGEVSSSRASSSSARRLGPRRRFARAKRRSDRGMKAEFYTDFRTSVDVQLAAHPVSMAGHSALDLLHDLGSDVAEGLRRGRLRVHDHDRVAGVAADDD